MKKLIFHLVYIVGLSTLFTACTKEGPLPKFSEAGNVGIALNTASLTPSARDSNDFRLRISWNNALFATAFSNVKYITEIDMVGNNFRDPISRTTMGALSDSFQNKVINDLVLRRGTAVGAFADLEARVVASYANNNDRRISSPVPFRFRAYRVPPQVNPPSTNRLFIVGDATAGWWNSNAPLPAQELMRVNQTTYGGMLDFVVGPGLSYLLLPQNNDGGWDLKFAVADASGPNAPFTGRFGHRPANAVWDVNFPGPPLGGWHRMMYDFQTGFYTVTPAAATPVPDSLYAIGSATAGGWANELSNSVLRTQRFRKLNSVQFTGTFNLRGGEMLKMITKVSQWQPQFGREGAEGNLGFNYGGGADPDVIIVPPASGNYRIDVNFLTMSYTLTRL